MITTRIMRDTDSQCRVVFCRRSWMVGMGWRRCLGIRGGFSHRERKLLFVLLVEIPKILERSL